MSRTSSLPLPLLLLLGALIVVAPACGKRGPPLPPLHPAPERVADLSIVRRETDVSLRFATPLRNIDGSEPLVFDRIEIFALTVDAGGTRPSAEQVLSPKNRIATIARPVPVARPADAATEPQVPVLLSFVEKVAIVKAVAPPAPVAAVPDAPAATGAVGPAVVPPASATLAVATRFYLVVPYANRTRAGGLSDVLAVPLGPVPVAPHDATITYDDQALTLKWVAGVAGQSFHVYDANAAAIETAKPLTGTALTTAEFKRPVVFGAPVCFAVRGVRVAGPVTMESPISTAVCATPVDTFAPPAPTGLTAFAGTGAVTLTWDAVTAADLAGYLVLRGEGSGDRLQPLTSSLVSGTSFVDTTTRAGVRYVYAVVAVDNATRANRSKESNRVAETGR